MKGAPGQTSAVELHHAHLPCSRELVQRGWRRVLRKRPIRTGPSVKISANPIFRSNTLFLGIMEKYWEPLPRRTQVPSCPRCQLPHKHRCSTARWKTLGSFPEHSEAARTAPESRDAVTAPALAQRVRHMLGTTCCGEGPSPPADVAARRCRTHSSLRASASSERPVSVLTARRTPVAAPPGAGGAPPLRAGPTGEPGKRGPYRTAQHAPARATPVGQTRLFLPSSNWLPTARRRGSLVEHRPTNPV